MSDALDYREASFDPVTGWRLWWPIAAQEYRSLFRSKMGVAMFCVFLLPGVVRLVMLLVFFGVLRFGPPALRNRVAERDPTLDPHRVEFYLEPVLSVRPGMVFFLLLTSLVVARSIARDRVTNALELYWTRAVSPRAYVFAKWLGCCLLVGTVTVVVPVVLWLVTWLLADDGWRHLATAGPMGLGLCGLAFATAALTGICVLLSAACATPNTAMIAWGMLIVGSSAVAVVLSTALGEPTLSSVGIWNAGAILARTIADVPQRGVSWPVSLVTLAVLLLGAWSLARRRLALTVTIG